jgi:hypothetical protein
MRTLLDLPYLSISLHEGPTPVLELQWLGYAPSADFRAIALQALALSQQHQVRAWVVDDRRLGAVRPRDLEWVEQAILAPLDQSGLQRFAQLEPLDALNRHIIGGMYTHAQLTLSFKVQNFEDIAQARAWASGHA